MEIRPADVDDERVAALLQLHLAGMHETSPPGTVFALDDSGLRDPAVTFVGLWDGEELMAFGALKELSASTGELKSMRTSPAFLRRGAARVILEHLVDVARSRGYERLSLETGSGEPFEAAIGLYERHGFVEGAAFADYPAGSEFSRFFHLDL